MPKKQEPKLKNKADAKADKAADKAKAKAKNADKQAKAKTSKANTKQPSKSKDAKSTPKPAARSTSTAKADKPKKGGKAPVTPTPAVDPKDTKATTPAKGGKKGKDASTDAKRKATTAPPAKDPGPSKKSKTDKADSDAKKDDSKKADDTNIVKVITKGGAAVDSFVPGKQNYRVHQEGGEIFAATLNQSNLDANNNKFYILQVLLNQKTNSFFFWTRWGRVGVPGANALAGPTTKDQAIREYRKKLADKTVKGDYTKLDIKYDQDQKKDDKPKASGGAAKAAGASKLHPTLQGLINLIFDTNVMNNTMKEIGYDAKKMPLGKLGESTVKQAYTVLSNLSKAIKKKDHQQMKNLSSQFYSLIPHDFGFKKMINFIIDDDEKVKKKIEMLDAISDMKITTKLLENQNATDNVVDQNYKKLGCDITVVEKNMPDWKIISEYLHNTKENWKIDIEAIYKIKRDPDEKNFRKDVKNNMLLWHGSRIANFVGILSQGLRIAPPEAPVSGYLFGKGIYLADMIDKSAHYCRSYGSDTALCLLVEGALGNPNVLLNSSYEAKELMEKAGKHSTKCHGSKAPPESSYQKFEGVIIPKGKPVPTGSGSYMGHNEFIVYNTNQAKIRYVVRMKMN